MVTWLLMLSLFGQEPELSPPPPPPPVAPQSETRAPLQPAEVDPLPPPPLPPPEASAVDEGPGAPARVFGSMGFATLGAAGTAALWYLVSNCSGSACVLLGIFGTGLGVAGIVAGAWGGHRLFGGQSGLGWAILGVATGAVVGFVGYFLAAGAVRPGPVAPWVPVAVASASAALASGGPLELGHFLATRNKRRVVLLPMPLPGGAGLALAGAL